ncbi:MAG: SGNH/GDSL hydrolase family protein [Lachnospiraceae bacterium]|nr:SGNH/GDSL hydrolase family protein [Lachnospiraceae bacterium]
MDNEEIKNTIEDTPASDGQVSDEHLIVTDEVVKKKKPGFIARFARLLICGGIALAVFAVFFVIFLINESKNTAEYAPQIVIMGDSIFASSIDDTSVGAMLAEKMNVEIADVSFGGSSMSYVDRKCRMDFTEDAFCMAALTQAILSNDFRYQENAHVRQNVAEYFDERVELLKSIDFSKVDIMIIDHLLNDYQIAAPINSGSNYYDEYTYEGAFRSVITQLKEEYPNMRIIVVAPIKSWYTEENILSSEYDAGGGTIDQYIEIQKKLAEEYRVEWISLYDVYDDKRFSVDNIHPNAEARELIADYLYDYLANGE